MNVINEFDWIQQDRDSPYESFYHVSKPFIMIVEDTGSGQDIFNQYYIQVVEDSTPAGIVTAMDTAWAGREALTYEKYPIASQKLQL